MNIIIPLTLLQQKIDPESPLFCHEVSNHIVSTFLTTLMDDCKIVRWIMTEKLTHNQLGLSPAVHIVALRNHQFYILIEITRQLLCISRFETEYDLLRNLSLYRKSQKKQDCKKSNSE